MLEGNGDENSLLQQDGEQKLEKKHMSRAMRKCVVSYANNKGADQPALPRSLISAFVVRCLDSIISLDSIAEISRIELASVAAQAGLCLAWSETPVDMFSHVAAQFYLILDLYRNYRMSKISIC